MNKISNLFFIGGAKGVGKTTLTSSICLDLDLERIETGKIVFNYISNKSQIGLNDYIYNELLNYQGEDILVDTHYSAYPHQKGMDTSFKRGLDAKHLQDLSKKFNINLCHIILNPNELLKRRVRDRKSRITTLELVKEELEHNVRACQMYSQEIGKSPLIITNNKSKETRDILKSWINTIISQQQ